MEKRDGFVFYLSWHRAIQRLKLTDKLHMYEKICAYGLGFDYRLPRHLDVYWLLIQPLIDNNNKKYNDGKKGGRPTKNKPVVIETENQWLLNEETKAQAAIGAFKDYRKLMKAVDIKKKQGAFGGGSIGGLSIEGGIPNDFKTLD